MAANREASGKGLWDGKGRQHLCLPVPVLWLARRSALWPGCLRTLSSVRSGQIAGGTSLGLVVSFEPSCREGETWAGPWLTVPAGRPGGSLFLVCVLARLPSDCVCKGLEDLPVFACRRAFSGFAIVLMSLLFGFARVVAVVPGPIG